MTNDEYIAETIRRAKEGDYEAAKDCLDNVITDIYTNNIKSPYLLYLAECLELFVDNVPIETALGLDGKKPNTNPKKYDEKEISAVDLILREHCGFNATKANEWIEDNIGASKRTVEPIRSAYCSRYNEKTDPDMSEERRREYLLHDLSPEVRRKVSDVLALT